MEKAGAEEDQDPHGEGEPMPTSKRGKRTGKGKAKAKATNKGKASGGARRAQVDSALFEAVPPSKKGTTWLSTWPRA